jgi:hypothetical protein
MSDAANQLWEEYRSPFSEFDDLTLARWLSQTLSQFEGRIWRMSHPLVTAYRAAAEIANDRQIWLKRLATAPAGFAAAECCRAPLLPLFTRDVINSGLICQHCGGTAVAWDDLPESDRERIDAWAREYADIHAVAHYDDTQIALLDDYDDAFETAAESAEQLLRKAALDIVPPLLETYTAVIWEDQDECLEVEPKDIVTWA